MKKESAHTLDIGGRVVPLNIRRNSKARRLILSIDAETEGAVLTLPKRVSLKEGMDMARSKASWIASRLNALPEKVPFVDGSMVPLLGEEHRIIHVEGSGPPVRLGEGEILVSGKAEHLPRRLSDWFRAEAKRRIALLAVAKAAMLERTPGRITIRDTRSRWGSCTSGGDLSFCWRLVMAPEMVLDYVVAHEVAHLEHLNHGDKFWSTVGRLTGDAKAAKKWLRRNGEDLRRYG